ncbi:hypothetical protein DL768_001768 [Monosporascus sp. mg162]|nr:hypothetical protein DL768_001768 [Monosporascus sp. mg162]
MAPSKVTKALLGLACLVSLCAAATRNEEEKEKPEAVRQPNFVFIITDDQDLLLDSLEYQPLLKRHITDQGTTFSKHYCTISICCPSRVSLLTGRAAHNTNVTDVSAPYGGYTKFLAEGWNDNYLPVWLQQAGYNTYYTGKLMNGHSTTTYNKPFPAGWTGTNFFLDPATYIYYNVTMQRNQDAPKAYPGEYSTDLVTAASLGFLDEAITEAKPFFVGVAPIGPHSETINGKFNPAVPADRHKDLFPNLKASRTANFNPDTASGASWIKTLQKLNQTVIDYLDEFYRLRILSLQAVDELVDSIVRRLEESPEVLENTYIIYTTDNGFHVGQHRLAPGKTCPIEEDLNIPFIVRGPGVEKGKTVSVPTSHTDIAPTIFELAGIPLQEDFDGSPMPVTKAQQEAVKAYKAEHVNIEFWGKNIPEGRFPGDGPGLANGSRVNNTYKSLRVISERYDLAYTVWCSNEHELYEMKSDPGQMVNLYETSNRGNSNIYDWEAQKLISRLDALLLTLKTCKGVSCRRPWSTLHPRGDVLSLEQAMDPKFDEFYAEGQNKVSFSACVGGFITDYEGAMESKPFLEENYGISRQARWEDWT